VHPVQWYKSLGFKADIWALGIMYYKLIETVYPFKLMKTRGNKWVYKQKKIRLPRKMNQWQKWFLGKMLDIEPRKRANTSQLIQILKAKLFGFNE
jgi:serine/threonine protein kinase